MFSCSEHHIKGGDDVFYARKRLTKDSGVRQNMISHDPGCFFDFCEGSSLTRRREERF